MSKPPVPKQRDIFTWGCRNTTKTIPPSPPGNVSGEANASNMANVADVLNEFKLLQADFWPKLDNINTRLTDMANSMATLESKVTEVKRDVSSHTARVDEAERRISDTEDAMEKNRCRTGHPVNCLSWI